MSADALRRAIDLRAELGDPTQTNRMIAARHGVSTRTVIRWRRWHSTPSTWAPTPPECGTPNAYRAGCRCADCRAAHAARIAADTAALQAATVPHATRHRARWEPWEDEHLRQVGPVRAARDLGRTYVACAQRTRLHHA